MTDSLRGRLTIDDRKLPDLMESLAPLIRRTKDGSTASAGLLGFSLISMDIVGGE